jgi:PIN domain nuclease of toxin-antitoxin system
MSSDQRYVIDTHVLVWYLAASKKLRPEVLEILKEIQPGKAQGLISVILLTWMKCFRPYGNDKPTGD